FSRDWSSDVCSSDLNQHKPDCTICFRVRRYHLATCHTYECKECIYMKSNAHCLKHNELYCGCWHRKADHDDRGHCKVCKCDWFQIGRASCRERVESA